MEKKTHFAEVIESCLDHYIAQSWAWNYFPSFGSLVCVDTKDKTIFGIVCNIKTGTIDPNRSPFPYQKTEEELQAEQPQIFEFLKTTFTVQIVGYQEKSTSIDTIYYILPPTPCKIHAFVKECSHDIQEAFFKNPSFLHLLFAFAHQVSNIDELLLAIIKQLAERNIFDSKTIDHMYQTLTLLIGNDYRRLKLFLKRVESITSLILPTSKNHPK